MKTKPELAIRTHSADRIIPSCVLFLVEWAYVTCCLAPVLSLIQDGRKSSPTGGLVTSSVEYHSLSLHLFIQTNYEPSEHYCKSILLSHEVVSSRLGNKRRDHSKLPSPWYLNHSLAVE